MDNKNQKLDLFFQHLNDVNKDIKKQIHVIERENGVIICISINFCKEDVCHLRKAAEISGYEHCNILYTIMAIAYGMELSVADIAEGNLIVNIEQDFYEAAIVALGGIICEMIGNNLKAESIANDILRFLEEAPIQVSADIIDGNGIYMTRYDDRFKNMGNKITQITHLPVHFNDEPDVITHGVHRILEKSHESLYFLPNNKN